VKIDISREQMNYNIINCYPFAVARIGFRTPLDASYYSYAVCSRAIITSLNVFVAIFGYTSTDIPGFLPYWFRRLLWACCSTVCSTDCGTIYSRIWENL